MKTEYLYDLPEHWQAAAAVFSALGDPARQRILLLFEPGEALSIKAIADLFPLSRTAVVHHLSVLERAGILSQERRGKTSLYSLRPEVAFQAVNALREYILIEYPGLEESGASASEGSGPMSHGAAAASAPAGAEGRGLTSGSRATSADPAGGPEGRGRGSAGAGSARVHEDRGSDDMLNPNRTTRKGGRS